MKLLFDHHLSHKLVKRLQDIFPDSSQTRLLGMGTADDHAIWNHAKQRGFIVVSLDADFYDLRDFHKRAGRPRCIRTGCPIDAPHR
jgi:predicted nuclease of predicted toxin-antitoxin system